MVGLIAHITVYVTGPDFFYYATQSTVLRTASSFIVILRDYVVSWCPELLPLMPIDVPFELLPFNFFIPYITQVTILYNLWTSTSKHQQDWKQNATEIQNRKNAKACQFVSELSVGEKNYCHQKSKIGKYCGGERSQT